MVTFSWTDGTTESVYHHEYGGIAGRVQKITDVRWYAEQGGDYCGHYVTERDAKNAVEHATKDPHRMPFPIER